MIGKKALIIRHKETQVLFAYSSPFEARYCEAYSYRSLMSVHSLCAPSFQSLGVMHEAFTIFGVIWIIIYAEENSQHISSCIWLQREVSVIKHINNSSWKSNTRIIIF